jgi:peptidoglycan/LPS O-acetylase OafA/YrhL
LLNGAGMAAWMANLLFYANLPPFYLDYSNGHFWSLGVEMQFYAAIAIVVAIAGGRGLWLVPIGCAAVTGARVVFGVHISIVTWWRVDEILAGGCLALLWGARVTPAMTPIAPFLLGPLLLASCHPLAGPLQYARPYLAALLIGSTMLQPKSVFHRILCGRALGYLAEISYALYVIHPLTYTGWLGSGDVIERYAKRVVSLCLTFIFAHFSTRYYEKYWIELGHRLAKNMESSGFYRASYRRKLP